jgi:hypothetical protein
VAQLEPDGDWKAIARNAGRVETIDPGVMEHVLAARQGDRRGTLGACLTRRFEASAAPCWAL